MQVEKIGPVIMANNSEWNDLLETEDGSGCGHKPLKLVVQTYSEGNQNGRKQ